LLLGVRRVAYSVHMDVLIMAAGQSLRLKNYIGGLPKCLFESNGKTLLLRTYENLIQFNSNIHIVTGHKDSLILDYIKEQKLNINVIFNKHYKSNGSMHSITTAFDEISPKESLMVIDGDLIFEKFALDLIANQKISSIIVTNHSNSNDESTPKFNKGLLENFTKERNELGDFPEYIGISNFKTELIEEMKIIDKEANFNLPYEIALAQALKNKRFCLNFIYAPYLLWSDLDIRSDLTRMNRITVKIDNQ
jgi:choline kinase